MKVLALSFQFSSFNSHLSILSSHLSVALLLYCSIALHSPLSALCSLLSALCSLLSALCSLLSALRSIALKNTGLPRRFQRLAMTVIPQTYAVAQTKTIPFSLISHLFISISTRVLVISATSIGLAM